MTDSQQTPATDPSEAVSWEAFDADQQQRRAELAARIGVFCDNITLPGEDGDAAYDLLREAAARIGSDRLRFEREALALATAPASTGAGPCPDCGDLPMFGDHTFDCKANTTAEARADGDVEALTDMLEAAYPDGNMLGVRNVPPEVWQRITSALATQPAPVSGADAGLREALRGDLERLTGVPAGSTALPAGFWAGCTTDDADAGGGTAAGATDCAAACDARIEAAAMAVSAIFILRTPV